jgi:hypothetical protein
MQELKNATGDNGVIVIDTNSHHDETLQRLDPIAALKAPTTVAPHCWFPSVNDSA